MLLLRRNDLIYLCVFVHYGIVIKKQQQKHLKFSSTNDELDLTFSHNLIKKTSLFKLIPLQYYYPTKFITSLRRKF